MAFHSINQGKHFIYCHLMHALMSTCYSMSFKISSIGIRAHTWMTFKLAYLGYFGFPNFWFGSHFFFHLVLIIGFQALLVLETCRNIVWSKTFFLWFLELIWCDFENWGLFWFLLLCVFCVIFGFILKDWCLRMET